MPEYQQRSCVIVSDYLHCLTDACIEALSWIGNGVLQGSTGWRTALVCMPAIGNTIFTEESWLCLLHGEARVLHRRGERYADPCVIEREWWGAGNVMVWNTQLWQEWTCCAEWHTQRPKLQESDPTRGSALCPRWWADIPAGQRLLSLNLPHTGLPDIKYSLNTALASMLTHPVTHRAPARGLTDRQISSRDQPPQTLVQLCLANQEVWMISHRQGLPTWSQPCNADAA